MSINEEPITGDEDDTENDVASAVANDDDANTDSAAASASTTTTDPTSPTPTTSNKKKKKKSKSMIKKIPVSSKLLLGSVLIHGLVWLLVGMFLFIINLVTTLLMPPWFLFPVLGWGIGLGLHVAVACGVVVSLGREQDLAAMVDMLGNLLAPLLPLLQQLVPLLQQAMTLVASLLTNLTNALVEKMNENKKENVVNDKKEE
jgi:2TM domain